MAGILDLHIGFSHLSFQTGTGVDIGHFVLRQFAKTLETKESSGARNGRYYAERFMQEAEI